MTVFICAIVLAAAATSYMLFLVSKRLSLCGNSLIITVSVLNMLFCISFPLLFALIGGKTASGAPARGLPVVLPILAALTAIYILLVIWRVALRSPSLNLKMRLPGQDLSPSLISADMPVAPDMPIATDMNVAIDMPVATDMPLMPDISITPDIQDKPHVPEMPYIPDIPHIPAMPQIPEMPHTPETPVYPEPAHAAGAGIAFGAEKPEADSEIAGFETRTGGLDTLADEFETLLAEFETPAGEFKKAAGGFETLNEEMYIEFDKNTVDTVKNLDKMGMTIEFHDDSKSIEINMLIDRAFDCLNGGNPEEAAEYFYSAIEKKPSLGFEIKIAIQLSMIYSELGHADLSLDILTNYKDKYRDQLSEEDRASIEAGISIILSQ